MIGFDGDRLELDDFHGVSRSSCPAFHHADAAVPDSFSHLEADVLELRVKVVQHSATVKYKGRLPHLFVNLLIVQLLLVT